MITADQLLAGPRGRRMLLSYALASERANNPEYTEESLWHVVMHAAYDLDPGRGVSRGFVTIGHDGTPLPVITPEEVAGRLAEVTLIDVTPELLRESLAHAVDNSRPFQEPDGEDFLAEKPPVYEALKRIADHISRSAHTDWWCTALDPCDQWAIEWFDPATYDIPDWVPQTYAAWKEHTVASNRRAQRQRPADPAANYSGEWWSIPPVFLKRTSHMMFDGSPAGLWFEEDRGNEESAVARRLIAPPDIRVYEIDQARDWAELCRRYPLDVSYERKHDWYRSTGRVGQWLIPDWSLVVADFDAVHLTVAAYLSAVGTAIPVSEDTASVIAGWNPDETWWLTEEFSLGESVTWHQRLVADPYIYGWVRD